MDNGKEDGVCGLASGADANCSCCGTCREAPRKEAQVAEFDNIERPKHYCEGGIETLDFIIAKGLNFCLGNVVKYVSRAGKKEPGKYKEDLQKAEQYLKRAIKEADDAKGE